MTRLLRIFIRKIKSALRLLLRSLRRVTNNPEQVADRNPLISDYIDHRLDHINDAFKNRLKAFDIVPGVHISQEAATYYYGGHFAEAACFSETFLGDPGGYTPWLDKVLDTARELLEMAIKKAPLYADAFDALGCNAWFRGKYSEALIHFAGGMATRRQIAKVAGWNPDDYVFLPRGCIQVIGLMGHLDAFAKRKILDQDHRKYILLAPENEIVNKIFLDYWSDHFEIITDANKINELSILEPAYTANWNWVFPVNGEVLQVHSGIAKTQKDWCDQNREPLLNLKPNHQIELQNYLSRCGLRSSDWYMALHVRSSGFHDQGGASQAFRNTSIEEYYPAIDAITEAGGWVIRLGDASMPGIDHSRLRHPQKVIDYAKSPDKTATLDIALSACCRLFVSGPQSGMYTVAKAFGRPCLIINSAVYPGFPWVPGDIFVPKLRIKKSDGQLQSFEEMLMSEDVRADHQFLLDRVGIELLDVPKDLISEAVCEALDPRDYDARHPGKGDTALKCFIEANHHYKRFIMGRPARAFCERYEKMLTVSQIEA
jgi:putative glycosyltransferase (TIGR04372 family)